jgi:hypothetical protein
MRAKLTFAALAIALGAALPAAAQTNDFDKVHTAAQSAGVCTAALSAAAEDKVGAIAAKSADAAWMVGGTLSRENSVRGKARVDAYSLGCSAESVAAAVKAYDSYK